jgi:hypothetical protein
VAASHGHPATVRLTTDNPGLSPRPTQRALIRADIVFVTKYRWPVFTEAMVIFGEYAMRAELDVEMVPFDSQIYRAYDPPALAISTLCSGSRASSSTRCAASSPAPVSAPGAQPPLVFVPLRRLLPRRTVP